MFKRVEKLPFNDIVIGSYRGRQICLHLTRGQVLLIQFSKLLNFFADQLEPEWGGGLDVLSKERFASARYLYETTVMSRHTRECWVHRLDGHKPWGPDNWTLKDVPNIELGAPFEPYFSCNGGILGLNQASRVLGVDNKELFHLKLQHLLDELVIRECIKNLLKPPALWARRDEFTKGLVPSVTPKSN